MDSTVESNLDNHDAPAAAEDSKEGSKEDSTIDTLAIANLPFAEDLYFQFLRDPSSVDPTWRRIFERLDGVAKNGKNGTIGPALAAAYVPPAAFPHSVFAATAGAYTPSPPGAIQSRTSVRLLAERVQRLVEAYREHGHLAVDLDPLGLVKRTGP